MEGYSKLKFTLPLCKRRNNFILRKNDAVIIIWGFFEKEETAWQIP